MRRSILTLAAAAVAVVLLPVGVSTPVVAGGACTIAGTPGNDVLHGTPDDDVICAGPGHDRINGRGGNDVLYGGTGPDQIEAGAGFDVVIAGGGNDYIADGGGNDQTKGGGGADYVFGGRGNDRHSGGEGSDLGIVDFGGDGVVRGGPGNEHCLATWDTSAATGSTAAMATTCTQRMRGTRWSRRSRSSSASPNDLRLRPGRRFTGLASFVRGPPRIVGCQWVATCASTPGRSRRTCGRWTVPRYAASSGPSARTDARSHGSRSPSPSRRGSALRIRC